MRVVRKAAAETGTARVPTTTEANNIRSRMPLRPVHGHQKRQAAPGQGPDHLPADDLILQMGVVQETVDPSQGAIGLATHALGQV